ncbi:hypothetical protein Tco_0508613 [Tanacetum coccineum]
MKRRNRRRSKKIVKPELRTIVETPVATMADTHTMSKLLQASTEGYGDAIVLPAILVEIFELKVGLLTLTTNLKNDITNFHQRFDETFSEAWDHFKDLLRKCPHYGVLELHQIDTFYNALTQSDQNSLNAAAGGNLLNRTPQDALTVIENKSKVRTSRNKPVVLKISATTSSSTPAYLPKITTLIDAVKAMLLQNKTPSPAPAKAIEETFVTCGGSHLYNECLATDGNTFNASTATGTYNQGGHGYRPQGETNYHASNQMRPLGFPQSNVQNNQNRPSGSGSLPSNTIANTRGDLKAITTQSGVSYDGPTILTTSSPLPKEVEREPKTTKDKVQTTSSGSTAHVQPLVVQVPIPEPDVAPKPNPKPSIPYPSRLNDQKLQEKANNQMLKFLQIFQRLHFDLSFADSLLHMPKFSSTFKSLLINKEKLFELANTPLNENCSAVLLKKLPEKLGDPDVHGEELTLRVNDEAITFNFRHILRYSYRYDDESVNRINVIDVTCEEYAQEVLRFLDSSKSGNPTPSSNPIITTFSPSLTPFEGGDFILEEIEACLTSNSIPPGIDDADFDPEGDILLLEKLLNDDPSSPLPPKRNYF